MGCSSYESHICKVIIMRVLRAFYTDPLGLKKTILPNKIKYYYLQDFIGQKCLASFLKSWIC